MSACAAQKAYQWSVISERRIPWGAAAPPKGGEAKAKPLALLFAASKPASGRKECCRRQRLVPRWLLNRHRNRSSVAGMGSTKAARNFAVVQHFGDWTLLVGVQYLGCHRHRIPQSADQKRIFCACLSPSTYLKCLGQTSRLHLSILIELRR